MSGSGSHAHSDAVTAMSRLRFQKHLRLQAARRLMPSESGDAAGAGDRNASHFSRGYNRHFGAPPMRDLGRLPDLATV